jgi:hypothetical protein
MASSLRSLLDCPIVAAVAIPILLAVAGVLAKRLIRGPRSKWYWEDWYLGLELTLATFASELVYIAAQPSDLRGGRIANYMALTLVGFVAVVYWHMNWEPQRRQPRRRRVMLNGCANLVGLSLLGGFVAIVGTSG